MPSYNEASKRLVCVAPLDRALNLQSFLEIVNYLWGTRILLHYACPGVCVCMCSIQALKRVLLTSIEYKYSLCRLFSYFSVWWLALARGTTVHFAMTEEAMSLYDLATCNGRGLFYAPSFLTFCLLVVCV